MESSLGGGAFGKVYRVRDLKPNGKSSLGRFFNRTLSLRGGATSSGEDKTKAMKMMDQNEIADNELLVLMRLEHDNVLKYFDHFQFQFKIADVRSKFVTKLCVITEFCQVISSFIHTSFF